jgi:hypothetical protein
VAKRTHAPMPVCRPLPDAAPPPPPPPPAAAAEAPAAAGAALARAGRRRLAAAAPWRHRREREEGLSAPGAEHERCRDRSTGRTQGGVYGWFGVLGQQAQVPCGERRGGGAHRLSCGRGGWRRRRRGGGGGGVSGLLGSEGEHARRDAHHRVRAQHPLLCAPGPSRGRVLQSCVHSLPAGCLVLTVQRRVGEVQLVETLQDLFTAHPVSQPSIIARR